MARLREFYIKDTVVLNWLNNLVLQISNGSSTYWRKSP